MALAGRFLAAIRPLRTSQILQSSSALQLNPAHRLSVVRLPGARFSGDKTNRFSKEYYDSVCEIEL